MRRAVELSVEWVAAPDATRDAALDETQEGSLPQSMRSARRHGFLSALLMAVCLILFAPRAGASEAVAAAANAYAGLEVTPPAAGSGNEAQGKLSLAQKQGLADTALLDWVMENSGPLKGDMRAGELRIAFTVTPAEGWWDKAGGGKLAWHDAPENSVHLRIFVVDDNDGRFVPGLSVHAMLIDSNGNEQSAPADFGWYPLINAYGGNFPLDADSSYTLRVTVDPLPRLHVFDEGKRFRQTMIAEFPPVQIGFDAVAQLPLATDTGVANEAELLRPGNAALGTAITELWKESVSGVEKADGDYFTSYALDFSALVTPIPGAMIHIGNMIGQGGKNSLQVVLLVRDSRTGRFIPALKPQASLIAADGKSYGPGELFLAWHPWLNHYGRAARIPRKGLYKLRVHFDAPGFRRWGRQSERFAAPGEVEFEELRLTPEKKE